MLRWPHEAATPFDGGMRRKAVTSLAEICGDIRTVAQRRSDMELDSAHMGVELLHIFQVRHA